MKATLLTLLCGALFLPSVCHGREATELERAIHKLPPQFVADVPLSRRSFLIDRLEPAGTFLHYFSDAIPGEAADATSMLWMRQFRRADGGFVILTHMSKPFSGGNDDSAPRANQTFVLDRRDGKWVDITAKVFPARTDLTNHFRPHAASDIVEIAPYVRTKRRDDRGYYWDFGPRVLELHWNGHVFEERKPTKDTLSKW